MVMVRCGGGAFEGKALWIALKKQSLIGACKLGTNLFVTTLWSCVLRTGVQPLQYQVV